MCKMDLPEEISEVAPSIEIDIELLITLVQERPVLWDKSLESYKSKTETTNAWREICIQLKPDFEDLNDMEKIKFCKEMQKKWTNLKDSQMKYLKKLSKTCSRAKTFKKYVYSDQLSFLSKNYDINRISDSNGTQNDDNATSEPETLSDRIELENGLPRKQRKLETETTQKPPEDRNISFFKGILPSVQRLSDEEVVRFQAGVLGILQDIHKSRMPSTSSSSYNASQWNWQPSSFSHLGQSTYNQYPATSICPTGTPIPASQSTLTGWDQRQPGASSSQTSQPPVQPFQNLPQFSPESALSENSDAY